MSLLRERDPLFYEYNIDDVALGRVRGYREHVITIAAKACSKLRFMNRICKSFKNVDTLKSVYCARSHLKYTLVVIWFPYQFTLVDKIESIQEKKFVTYALATLQEQICIDGY